MTLLTVFDLYHTRTRGSIVGRLRHFLKMQPQALEEVNLLYNLKNPIVLLLIDRGEKRLQTGFQFSSLQRSLTARSGMRDDGG